MKRALSSAGKVGVALLLLNEARGLVTVALILWGWK